MAFDPSQYDRLTAAARANARLEDFEEEGRKHGMLPRNPKRGLTWWLGWLFIAAVLLGFVYWFAAGWNSAPPTGDDFGLSLVWLVKR